MKHRTGAEGKKKGAATVAETVRLDGRNLLIKDRFPRCLGKPGAARGSIAHLYKRAMQP